MEIMERSVQIRIILIFILFLFFSGHSIAQHQIDEDVTFSYKGKKNYAKLNPFLGYYEFDHNKLEKCMTASGIIKFQITPKGKIASINTYGNLPKELIEAVKERIMLTENCWIFSKNISNKNIEFYYPIYLYINRQDKCNIETHESMMLLNMLFEKQEVVRVKENTYMIKPAVWSAIR
jgi:hypothetical protein